MNQSLLSVVIPVWNTDPALLQECIASVTTSLRGISHQILVCDDGSARENGTEYRLICADAEARMVSNYRNLGMAVARNRGALLSDAVYLLFVDSDDLLLPVPVAEIGKAMSRNPQLIIADHCNLAFDGSTVTSSRPKAQYLQALASSIGTIEDPFLYATFLFHPFVVKRTLFLDLGGFSLERSSGEEVDLHLRISGSIDFAEVYHVRREWYGYRNNPNSVVHDPALYAALIGNIEDIIGVHASQRLGRRVTARRSGRSQLTGAAHYRLFAEERGIEFSPAWITPAFDVRDA